MKQSPALIKALWFGLGCTALALGMLGVLLPLLPTTPFILLAAFAFARSSQRWHRWLLQHAVFGPMIRNWQQHGAISRRAKYLSLASIAAVFLISVGLNVPFWALGVQTVVLLCVCVFIMTRPDPPPKEDQITR